MFKLWDFKLLALKLKRVGKQKAHILMTPSSVCDFAARRLGEPDANSNELHQDQVKAVHLFLTQESQLVVQEEAGRQSGDT